MGDVGKNNLNMFLSEENKLFKSAILGGMSLL